MVPQILASHTGFRWSIFHRQLYTGDVQAISSETKCRRICDWLFRVPFLTLCSTDSRGAFNSELLWQDEMIREYFNNALTLVFYSVIWLLSQCALGWLHSILLLSFWLRSVAIITVDLYGLVFGKLYASDRLALSSKADEGSVETALSCKKIPFLRCDFSLQFLQWLQVVCTMIEADANWTRV